MLTAKNKMRTGASLVIALLGSMIAACSLSSSTPGRVSARAPNIDTVPYDKLGASIRLGRKLVQATPVYARRYTGNELSCADCHLKDGTQAYAAPFAGLSGDFPAWNQRAGKVITLAERVEECFVRSENGRPLPADGRRMTALLAYMQWLSRDVPAGKTVQGRGFSPLPPPAAAPNPAAGQHTYRVICAACHGPQGGGEPPRIPPLWGPGSYNQGAGMNQIATMAAFVARWMPANQPGSLSPQQAYDVAAYIHGKPRPKLAPQYRSY